MISRILIMSGESHRIDVDKPLWNQHTYIGRWKHFSFITDYRTAFLPEEDLQDARKFCEDYKNGRAPADTTLDDIIFAKKLKDSAFHPDNGEFMDPVGRMSFQLPGSVIFTTAFFKFYKSGIGSFACQLVNQGYNAFVNYTNRNAVNEEPQDPDIVEKTFLCATIASCATVLCFKKILSCRGHVLQRWAPFCAVAAGHMVNLPVMRYREIAEGIPIFSDESGERCIMRSSVAAVKGISECLISRIVMAAPALITVPIIMERIHPTCFYQFRPWIGLPIKLFLCSICWFAMIPTALAIFPYKNSMRPELIALFCQSEYEDFNNSIRNMQRPCKVYYSKGL